MADGRTKEIAYGLDPECWESYSGKPVEFKRAMETRRQVSLAAAELACATCEAARPRKIRDLATMTPKEVHELFEIGLHQAKQRVDTSKLLDRVEAADSILELRALLSEFITMQTGVR